MPAFFLYLRKSRLFKSYLWKNTLPIFCPSSSVYKFFLLRFVSGFSSLGCLHAVLNKSVEANFSRRSVKSK